MLSVHFFTLRAAFFAFDISCDAGWKLRSHAERMAAYGVPHPALALVAGFALQFAGVGGLLLVAAI